jgi:hypothetical protein
MKYLDENINIVWWGSEELFIPYRSPVDKKMHRYFPDFIVKTQKKDGTVMTYMFWRSNPKSQTKQPNQKRKTKRFLQESITYAINQEKWKAADIFCRERGWQFKILTERDLGLV